MLPRVVPLHFTIVGLSLGVWVDFGGCVRCFDMNWYMFLERAVLVVIGGEAHLKATPLRAIALEILLRTCMEMRKRSVHFVPTSEHFHPLVLRRLCVVRVNIVLRNSHGMKPS
jgi:hypothetical protein